MKESYRLITKGLVFFCLVLGLISEIVYQADPSLIGRDTVFLYLGLAGLVVLIRMNELMFDILGQLKE